MCGNSCKAYRTELDTVVPRNIDCWGSHQLITNVTLKGSTLLIQLVPDNIEVFTSSFHVPSNVHREEGKAFFCLFAFYFFSLLRPF